MQRGAQYESCRKKEDKIKHIKHINALFVQIKTQNIKSKDNQLISTLHAALQN